ncbi:helix-turn-helix protein [Actinocorallia herbida]|uniref:Helix-turn-helix protein n=1 Tax=Actinocorallia herbida TaxID=58109 RepID=A0A3N1D0R7_9ACTN|nr:helix-turn-helix transcriptional regulator [Actinocorallia herbida]ROO86638.1 helix-turn-helix protein [Actinocorallia herbida]
MDRGELARFLRSRREALQPEDVGLPRSRHRRTSGLRREEVAELAAISADYYSRIEQQRGPRPSAQVLGAIADALRLTPEERDHLFRLAGHPVPARVAADPVDAGIMQIFQQLEDSPAQITNQRGEVLAQNRLSRLLLGDQTRHEGFARSFAYRWFTDPAERLLTPAEDRDRHSRTLTAQLLAARTRDPKDAGTAALVDELRDASPEFAALWHDRPVVGPYCPAKHLDHPLVGPLTLNGQTLLDPAHPHRLTVFTPADPDTDSRLALLSVLADETPMIHTRAHAQTTP